MSGRRKWSPSLRGNTCGRSGEMLPLPPGFSLRLVTKSGILVHYVSVFLFVGDGDLLLFQDNLLFYWDNRRAEGGGDRKKIPKHTIWNGIPFCVEDPQRLFFGAGRERGGRGSGPDNAPMARRRKKGRGGMGRESSSSMFEVPNWHLKRNVRPSLQPFAASPRIRCNTIPSLFFFKREFWGP